MVDLELNLLRGSFQLEIACRLEAPWTVIFGPSGAGKSTLLRLIAGLDKPDSGRIAIHGEYVRDTEIELQLRPGPLPGQCGVGMVTQQAALFPHQRVRANVAYGLHRQPAAESDQCVELVLELAGAAHLADRWPRELSGGEAQRVSLARALAPMPRLLLLDEPLSALDADARDQILTRMKDWLAEQKIQTILVTHDAADALATEAEVLLLKEGRIADFGPAIAVLAKERARLLARLH